MTTMEHPTAQELSDFLLGRLPGPRRVTVENHIAACDHCCALMRAVPDDTFAERFRGSAPSLADTRPAGNSVADAALQNTIPAELQNHPRYRIIKELGRGGMGVVYLAEHTFMERQVALKVIAKNLVRNVRAVDRFRKEVRAAAKLTHANIVTAHDADEAGGLHFLVMEYVDGVSLAKFVQKRGPLSAAQACNVIKQVARGLQHAHEKKMVHRDIKPQNLLLTKKGQVKILDFGLAKLTTSDDEESMTDAEMVLGTPDYIAPEQAYNSRMVDIRSDLYALGCTFYFLLTGQPPFRDGTAMDKMIKHNEAMATPVHHLRPDVPKALADIVAKLMAKKPEHRYQTPAELLQALTESSAVEEPFADLEIVEPVAPQADTTPIAHAPTLPDARRKTKKRSKSQKRKPASRKPLWMAAVVAGVLLFGAGAWGLVAALRDEKPSTTPNLAQNNNGNDKGLTKGTNLGKTKQDNTPPVVNGKPRVYMLLPANGFWYKDYQGTHEALVAGGADVKIVSTRTGQAVCDPNSGAPSGGGNVRIDVLMEDMKPDFCEAFIIVGGTGVRREFINGPHAAAAQELFRRMVSAKRVVGSQCIGTELLAASGVCREKNVASPLPEFAEVIARIGTEGARIKNENAIADGPIVTARGPDDGAAFATKLLEQIGKMPKN